MAKGAAVLDVVVCYSTRQRECNYFEFLEGGEMIL